MIKLDPMAEGGCPQCTWIKSNLGTHLDELCELHQGISNLKEDLAMEREVSRAQDVILAKLRDITGCEPEGDLVTEVQEWVDDCDGG